MRRKPIYYNGELKDVNPEEYGANLYREGKEVNHINDPCDKYFAKTEEDSEFFYQFFVSMQRGWMAERQKDFKKLYDENLPAFKESIPEVGECVYVEHMTSRGKYHYCRIEHVPEEKESVVIRYLESKGNYGEPKLSVVGLQSPTTGEFVKFHKKKPE
ncbi:MAG: hypothetical protein CL760_11540 [Chloroflexi bacterium]|nr:hypothetical protein [Chloroflexota bacterium]|tara:strand:+ start:975 stop:1448 length:474 start_codon:yes stop_codon:yes gene_type:complete